jgi:hypothetical protein
MERGIATDQKKVWTAIDGAVKAVEQWNEKWRFAESDYQDDDMINLRNDRSHNVLECLRGLRSDFATTPLPLFGKRIDGKNVKIRMRLDRGNPWHHQRPAALLQRAGVPKEERKALLTALGFSWPKRRRRSAKSRRS